MSEKGRKGDWIYYICCEKNASFYEYSFNSNSILLEHLSKNSHIHHNILTVPFMPLIPICSMPNDMSTSKSIVNITARYCEKKQEKKTWMRITISICQRQSVSHSVTNVIGIMNTFHMKKSNKNSLFLLVLCAVSIKWLEGSTIDFSYESHINFVCEYIWMNGWQSACGWHDFE